MLLEILMLAVAFLGSALAGIIDLKTTEVPDWIPYAMIGIGIVGNITKSLIVGSYIPVVMSVGVGFLLLGIGFLLYFTGQWGGGDAKIMSAIGFLLPQLSLTKSFFPFPVSFFFNVFFVGAFYMIAYTLVMALLNRKVFASFADDFRGRMKELLFLIAMTVGFLTVLGCILIFKFRLVGVQEMVVFGLIVLAMTIGMFTLWRFEKAVEKIGFKRRVKASELKEGDVLDDSKVWEGLTKEQAKKMMKQGNKYFVIKEGVRFAPVFPLALTVTVFFGDIVFWIVGLV